MKELAEQFAELQKSWVNQQQSMLKDWIDSMRGTHKDSLRASWREAADVMEQQVNSALAAQKDSLLACVAYIENVEGKPEAVSQGVEQLKSAIEQWSDIQGETWRIWFRTLRNSAPAPATPGEAMAEGWEELVRQTITLQEKWLGNKS